LLGEVIETRRLVLRPVELGFAPEVFREFTAEICRHMFPQPPRIIAETEAYIIDARAKMAAAEELAVFVLARDTTEFLGGAGMHNLRSDAPEAGIWIKQSAHGHAYGLEAVEGLVRWAFARGARQVLYPVMVENAASRRIPERLGGTLVRSFRKANAAGEMRDLVEYVIQRAD